MFLLFFSIDSPDSLDNVKEKWAPEAKHHGPGKPLIVVGTKTDLRTDERTIANLKAKGRHPITYKEGVELAKDVGAQKYVECSAKEYYNVREIFQEVTEEHFKSKSKAKEGTSAAVCCWRGGEGDEPLVLHTSAG